MNKKLKIGENSNLVAEVLDFVDRGMLLKSSVQTPLSSVVILDLETAKRFAWEEVYGEEELTWAEIRSEKMSEIWYRIYENEEDYSKIDIEISSVLDDLSHEVQKKLDQLHNDLLDDIVSDLKGCLFSRAVQGNNNKFFESILAIYQNGMWPCGWEGDWPNGVALSYCKSREYP